MIKVPSLILGAVLALGFGTAFAQGGDCCASKAGATATDPHAGHNAPAPKPDGSTAPAGGHEMSCCANKSGGMMDHGNMGPHGGMGGMGSVMPDAMQLLHNHGALERKVEDIPNGVKTTTTTKDPAVLELLRRHPREMYKFYESGGVVRPHDPMFSELAKVADTVTMEFKDVENGIEVVATSDDAEVVKLIRAHARKVSDFVARGHAALHEGAPLPEDYHPAK